MPPISPPATSDSSMSPLAFGGDLSCPLSVGTLRNLWLRKLMSAAAGSLSRGVKLWNAGLDGLFGVRSDISTCRSLRD